jgi:hypothetical protein
MLQKLVHFITQTNTGRLIVVALALVLGAYAARLYFVDLPAREEKAAAAAGSETIDAMADRLEQAISERGEEMAEKLPARTAWYPETLPCAAEVKFGTPSDPIWSTLGVKSEQKTAFQYRFEYSDDRFVIRARRDSDCDGIYAVWTLEGRTDWSAVLGRTIEAQNSKE